MFVIFPNIFENTISPVPNNPNATPAAISFFVSTSVKATKEAASIPKEAAILIIDAAFLSNTKASIALLIPDVMPEIEPIKPVIVSVSLLSFVINNVKARPYPTRSILPGVILLTNSFIF